MFDADEFPRWISTMPPSMESDLLGEHVSTAYFQARLSGWSEEELGYDARAAAQRGAGVGAIVERMRTLAVKGKVERKGYQNKNQPPQFELPEVLQVPIEWSRERVQLLRLIGKTKPTPDAADEMMKELIRQQKRRDVVPG